MTATFTPMLGDRDKLLRYHPAERPLALQLGGSDPTELARCAAVAEVRVLDVFRGTTKAVRPALKMCVVAAAGMGLRRGQPELWLPEQPRRLFGHVPGWR